MTTRRTSFLRALVVVVVVGLSWAAQAQTAAQRVLVYDGFLEIGGQPGSGAHQVTLHFVSGDGEALYREDVVVDVVGGRFSARLLGPLPELLYQTSPLFVTLDVDGAELEGRQELLPVPFATSAGGGVDVVVEDSARVRSGSAAVLGLERDEREGLAPQEWRIEVAGEDGDLTVVDVTGGERRALVLQPGAPSASFVVDDTGDVGLGTLAPAANLHVVGDAGDTKLLIEETSSTNAARELVELKNNGAAIIVLNDAGAPARWAVGNVGGVLVVNNQANLGVEFTLSGEGNLTIAGALTQNSDRRLKRDFVVVDDALELLRQVRGYAYTRRASGSRELGVIAQEVRAVFPEAVVADDDGLLSVAYGSLVAPLIEAVRALDDDRRAAQEQADALEARVEQLERELAARDQRLARIEARLKL